MYVMVSYDIVDDKTRLKVLKFLKNFGNRVQLSVFECNLTEEQFKRMKKGIEKIIDRREDKVRYYKICNSCIKRVQISGWGEVINVEDFEII